MSTHSANLAASEDLYVVPLSDGSFAVFAPLRGILLKANRDAVRAIARIVTDQHVLPDSAENIALVDTFKSYGLLDQVLYTNVPTAPPEHTYRGIILSLTANCNLRCVYCYASAGQVTNTMPWSIAKASLDQMLPWIGAKNGGFFRLIFHGGGEALVVKPLLKRCYEHASDVAQMNDIALGCSITTNATLIDEEFADWMAENVQLATLSIDGTAVHQNRQRPGLCGRPSFDDAIMGARRLRERGVKYTIRATITSWSLPDLGEIVEYLASEVLGEVKRIAVEPVAQLGRGAELETSRIVAEDFVQAYIGAAEIAEKYGVSFATSGDRLGRRPASTSFCGAPGTGLMCITPEGYVSSCPRITKSSEDSSSLFFYGRYHKESNSFQFDEVKYQALRKKQVQFLPECANCFCKWHCAGNCLSSRESDESDFNCEVTRKLSAWRLEKMLNTEGSTVTQFGCHEPADNARVEGVLI